ncbi:hypothetical protein [Allosphingosinicella indica]|uniref:Glycerophosphoryl diester phosphodiesterase membrane domain-containing protein n=1 Tax=Allosphingosinicella indica TaxID=941907 RepID=A0A1X7FZ84_9SPHN|nr:hypothetical protein [Allosphingosinicella indica]SMF61326.1 hypothetical protein SAMN06295910_0311 [Allosphingosinicella indica]
MKTLSIDKAWSETTAFLRAEGGLIFPVALALIAFPSIFVQWLTPTPVEGEAPQVGAAALLIIPLMAVTLIGSVAIAMLALRRETVVGAAIGAAARRMWPLLGAVLLIALAMVVAMVPLSLIAILLVSNPQSAVAVVIFMLIPIAILVGVRLLLVTAVAADTALGPVAILKASWRLTAGHFARLLGLLVLVMIVLLLIMMAVSFVVGAIVALTLGAPDPGTLSHFIMLVTLGLLNGIASAFFVVLTARVYRQLSGEGTIGA